MTTIITANIDENIKSEASAVLANMGLTISDVIESTLARIAREKTYDYQPNAETAEILQRVKEGTEPSATFDSIEDMIEDLQA